MYSAARDPGQQRHRAQRLEHAGAVVPSSPPPMTATLRAPRPARQGQARSGSIRPQITDKGASKASG
jgi:hypothetical protein